VADKMGIDLIWFGVLLAVNMQTSFMHPPFGFALCYLRSVAPKEDYRDKVTGKTIARVTTGEIYWGSIPFICIQLAMVVMVLLVPGIVTHYKQGVVKVDIETISIDVEGAYGGEGGYNADNGYYNDVNVDPGPEGASHQDQPATPDEEYNNLFK